MQVELTCSRVTCVDGEFIPQRMGDVVDVSSDEAARLVAAKMARPIETVGEPRTAAKPPGRNAAKRT